MSKLIELDAAIAETWKDTGYTDPLNVMTALRDRLEALPPVDAIPVRRGRWNCSDDAYENAVCSVCGWDTAEPWEYIKDRFEFCPNCGARMDGKGNGNETD